MNMMAENFIVYHILCKIYEILNVDIFIVFVYLYTCILAYSITLAWAWYGSSGNAITFDKQIASHTKKRLLISSLGSYIRVLL